MDVIRFGGLQPHPETWAVSEIDGITAIVRIWNRGDTMKCKLCPECAFRHESYCLVQTTSIVGPEEAPLFRIDDLGQQACPGQIGAGSAAQPRLLAHP